MKKSVLLIGFVILVTIFNSFIVTFAEENLGSWTTKTSMPTARRLLGVAQVNGKIYAIGGHNLSDGSFSTVEEYDLVTDKWTTKSSMPIKPPGIKAAEANGKIYAISEVNINNPINRVQEYDPITDEWTTKANMENNRVSFGVVEANGKIYAIGGGVNTAHYSNTVQEYDPATNTWTTKASMSTARQKLGLAQVNGKIYAIGGRSTGGNAINTVEEYDPATNTWTTKASMPTAREGLGVAQVNGKIYAIGGYNNSNKYLDIVEEYDPVTDKWATKANMPTARERLGVVEANGKIYAIGGYNDSNRDLDIVEEYTPPREILILDIEPEKETIDLNETVTTNLVIDNITEITAEDIKIQYDNQKLEFLGFEEVDGMKLVKSIEETVNGELRVIVASKGEVNVINTKEVLLKLRFKGIQSGEALVDITKGRVTDGIEMEKDLTAQECGEGTITIKALTDVNNDGEFTLLDLGIDARHFAKDPASPELAQYNTDIVVNGQIDEEDLLEIGRLMLENPNYAPNN